MAYPSIGNLIDLVNGLCLIEDKIKAEHELNFWKTRNSRMWRP